MGLIGSFFAGLFSSSKAQDVAIDAVRKLGGLDEMTASEKAQFLLDYSKTTAHQSPSRRFIAIILTLIFAVLCLVWIVAMGVGHYFALPSSIEFAKELKVFMVDLIVQPFNIIISFYFVMNIIQKVGK